MDEHQLFWIGWAISFSKSPASEMRMARGEIYWLAPEARCARDIARANASLVTSAMNA